MAKGDTPYTFDRVVRMVLSAATLIIVLALLRYLSDVLLPFAAAVVLAYLLNPLVTVFEQRLKRRGLAVAITLCGLGVVGAALIAIVIPVVFSQITRFRTDVGKLTEDLVASRAASIPAAPAREAPPVADGEAAAPAEKTSLGWQELTDAWHEYRRDAREQSRRERLAELRERLAGTYIGGLLEDAITYSKSDEFREFMVATAKKVIIGGWGVVAVAVNLVLGLTGLIIVVVYLAFLLLDYPEFARRWKSFLPPTYRDATVDFLLQFNAAMRQYFRGQFVVAGCTGILLAVGFTIIGLPMGLLYGALMGLLGMVPYLPLVAVVPGLLLAALRAIEGDASFVGSVLLFVLVIGVVQLIQETLIVPRVMGRATGLRPVAILLGVFVWGKLLGPLGVLLAIPLTCLGIAYYRRYILHHSVAATTLGAGTDG